MGALVYAQIDRFFHSGCVFRYESLVAAAERLVEITPPAIEKFAFANSGAEAVEGAVKLVKKVTGRQGWRIVPDPTGQPARTDYKVRGSDGRHTWLELTPHTGRTHQIRIHCAELGFPVMGDPIYGIDPKPTDPLMLHARAVSVPIDADKPVKITAPPPEHMVATLKACGWTESA